MSYYYTVQNFVDWIYKDSFTRQIFMCYVIFKIANKRSSKLLVSFLVSLPSLACSRVKEWRHQKYIYIYMYIFRFSSLSLNKCTFQSSTIWLLLAVHFVWLCLFPNCLLLLQLLVFLKLSFLFVCLFYPRVCHYSVNTASFCLEQCKTRYEITQNSQQLSALKLWKTTSANRYPHWIVSLRII